MSNHNPTLYLKTTSHCNHRDLAASYCCLTEGHYSGSSGQPKPHMSDLHFQTYSIVATDKYSTSKGAQELKKTRHKNKVSKVLLGSNRENNVLTSFDNIKNTVFHQQQDAQSYLCNN